MSVAAGNRILFDEMDIAMPDGLLQKAIGYEEEGKTAMLVAVDGKASGVLAISDRLKDSSAYAVEELKKMNLEVVMITGDNPRSAAEWQRRSAFRKLFRRFCPRRRPMRSEG